LEILCLQHLANTTQKLDTTTRFHFFLRAKLLHFRDPSCQWYYCVFL